MNINNTTNFPLHSIQLLLVPAIKHIFLRLDRDHFNANTKKFDLLHAMIGSGRKEAGNVGGPVVFVPSSALLISDIRRAPPRGKLCEFVPRRGARALEDFITGILLQLSGRYGDGRPRVLAKSTLRPLRVYGRGAEIKKDEREANPPFLAPSYRDS